MKVKFRAMALSAIHTGASTKYSTLTPFNRVPIKLKEAKVFLSKFKKEQGVLKRQAVALILIKLWDKMPSKGRVTIYDEIADHLLSSASASSKYEFLNLLSAKLKVRSITESETKSKMDITDLLNLFSDEELLDLIRNEHQYIIAVFRQLKDNKKTFEKETKDDKSKRTLLVLEDTGEINQVLAIEEELEKINLMPSNTQKIMKHIDYVPQINANSIRGVLRRIAMYNYFYLAGFIPNDLGNNTFSIDENLTEKGFDKYLSMKIGIPYHNYHTFFTGGMIKDSKGMEDIQEREDMIALCPMIGLLGTAKGNGTIQSVLSNYEGKLVCEENGYENEPSYHQLLNVEFGTRLDSEKLETLMKIVGEKDKKDSSTQMKYEFETIIRGAEFETGFELHTTNPLLISAFWHLMECFKKSAYIGGRISKGYGKLDLSNLEIPKDAGKMYVEWVVSKREEIQEKIGVKTETNV